MPMATPPASVAPRHAASIAPVKPPQTSVTPASASRLPTSSPSCAASEPGSALAGPITATCRFARISAGALHRTHQLQRAALMQRLVEVAALGTLHAGGAARLAGALGDQ